MFEGARYETIEGTEDVLINTAIMGQGDPLLLVHGYPETHLMWHKVAPALAQQYTVVACDLRGYGDSSKPHAASDHHTYTKRQMAADLVEGMAKLGFERFSVMGHDRGARVAYRLALDWPDVVEKLVLLDIVPTGDMYACGHPDLCKAIFHWYFLPQEEPMVEAMIAGNRIGYLNKQLGIAAPPNCDEAAARLYTQEVYEEYARCFDEASIHGTTEDYRAAYYIDRELDATDLMMGKKIMAPTLAIWGAKGLVEKYFEPVECWRQFCMFVQGCTVDAGHFIPEENPEGLLEALRGFLL